MRGRGWGGVSGGGRLDGRLLPPPPRPDKAGDGRGQPDPNGSGPMEANPAAARQIRRRGVDKAGGSRWRRIWRRHVKSGDERSRRGRGQSRAAGSRRIQSDEDGSGGGASNLATGGVDKVEGSRIRLEASQRVAVPDAGEDGPQRPANSEVVAARRRPGASSSGEAHCVLPA